MRAAASRATLKLPKMFTLRTATREMESACIRERMLAWEQVMHGKFHWHCTPFSKGSKGNAVPFLFTILPACSVPAVCTQAPIASPKDVCARSSAAFTSASEVMSAAHPTTFRSKLFRKCLCGIPIEVSNQNLRPVHGEAAYDASTKAGGATRYQSDEGLDAC